jgi:HlyD family secretion protein
MKPAQALRPALAVTVLAALLVALVWALRPVPVPVDLAVVMRAPMSVTVSAEGITRIRDTWRVTAPVAGQVARAPVHVGDAVIGGETVVAVIEPAAPPFLDTRDRRLAEAAVLEAQAAVRLAEAVLQQAVSDLTYLETELARARALADRGALAETALLDAEQAMRAAQAARAVAAADLDMRRATQARMEAQLAGPDPTGGPDSAPPECCLRLTAPRSGLVLEVAEQTARLVQAGETLVTIGDPTDLEIRVDLLSSDAVGVTRGTQAIVDRWGGEGLIQAEVRQIEPSAFTRVSALGIEEQRVPLVLDILTPPEARLGLGDRYRVYVTLVIWSQDDVLQVPQSALFRSAGRWALFVAQDGRAHLRIVDVGRMSGDTVQVLAGVDAGETVVVHPTASITDGTRLEPRDLGDGPG